MGASSLLRRYGEAIRILSLVPHGGTLLDLGAGTGRVLLTAAVIRPDIRCVGLEVVAERVRLTHRALHQRLCFARSCMLQRSLGTSKLPLPECDIVYLFNPFSPDTLSSVLRSLIRLASSCRFTLVMKAMDDVLETSSAAWLELQHCLRPVSCRVVGLPTSGFAAWKVAAPLSLPRRRLRVSFTGEKRPNCDVDVNRRTLSRSVHGVVS